MTRLEAEEMLSRQSLIFAYPRFHLYMNTFIIGSSAVTPVIVTVWVLIVWLLQKDNAADDASPIPILLVLLYVGLGATLTWGLRTRRHWKDHIIITREGLGRRNPQKEDVFVKWSEIQKTKRNIVRDEIHVYSRNHEKLFAIDVALTGFDRAIEVIGAMTE